MLLPDCKCRSGFFEVIRLLTFFPAVASSAVSAVVLSAVSAAPALFPCSSCAGRATRIGGYAKGRCKIALQRPRCRNLFVMPYPAGKSCRDSAPENLAGGACAAYFAWASVVPAWLGCRGGQAWTSTGYGFGRRRVSALRFPTGALRFRLFSKGILPAATVFCTRNCGGRSPASSW